MRDQFHVTLKFEDDSTDSITMTSNLKQNLESAIKKSAWLECEQTKRIINMNKVKWFQVSKVD